MMRRNNAKQIAAITVTALVALSLLLTGRLSAAPSAAAPKPPPKKLTAADVDRELTQFLSKDNIPFQFYSRYAGTYMRMAAQGKASLREHGKTMSADMRKKVLGQITRHEEIAKMLQTMVTHKKEIDAIRTNNSAVPPADRRQTYRNAQDAHEDLRVTLLSKLTGLSQAKVRKAVGYSFQGAAGPKED
mgnify:CR=1 FL=1